VYEMALTELSRYLPRTHLHTPNAAHNPHNRYLRSGMRGQRQEGDTASGDLTVPGELATPPAVEPGLQD
jgi:hypothetical protein